MGEVSRCEGLWPPCVCGLALCRPLHGSDDWIPMSDRQSIPLLPGLFLDFCSVELVPSLLPLPDFLILCICELDKNTSSERDYKWLTALPSLNPLPAYAFCLSVCFLLIVLLSSPPPPPSSSSSSSFPSSFFCDLSVRQTKNCFWR